MSYAKTQMAKLWLKLLKATVKGKSKKAAKLEQQIIAMELELRND
jgi:hypothetical protein